MLTVRQRYRQTDRETDGRTDGRTTYDSNTALALRASRGKKMVPRCRGSDSTEVLRNTTTGYSVEENNLIKYSSQFLFKYFMLTLCCFFVVKLLNFMQYLDRYVRLRY